MRQHHDTLIVPTPGAGMVDVTRQIAEILRRSGLSSGACTLLVRHTSASLVIQENADPAVQRDLVRSFARLAPEGAGYEHDAEGPDDMPAHVRSALTATTLTIPFQDGRLRLGTWQAVYLWEHRRHPHRREIAVHLMGE